MYLNKKKLRNSNKEEFSIIEEIGPNANNSMPLEKDISEDKNSITEKSKSELSSSTISARSKSEKLNTFSFIGRKDKTNNKKMKKNKEKEIKNHKSDDFNEKFLFLQKQLDELKEENKPQELKINNLEKELGLKFNNFEKEFHAQELKINNLQKEVRALNCQVKKLNEYCFADKLRKLSKKLIEYIIKNYYYSYMESNTYSKRIYFVKAPKLSQLYWAKDKDIINALNKMLQQLFSKAKSKDFIVHCFDAMTNKDKSYKKIDSVFKNKNEFFAFFDINGNDKIILDEIFPEKYLTIIDNTSSDIGPKYLKMKEKDL